MRVFAIVLCLVLMTPAWAQSPQELMQRQAALGELQKQAVQALQQHQYARCLKAYEELSDKADAMPLLPDAQPGTWQFGYNKNIANMRGLAVEGQGDMHRYLGEFDTSMALYRKALTMLPDPKDQAGIYDELADDEESLGNLEDALQDTKVAATLARQGAADAETHLDSAATGGDFLRAIDGIRSLVRVYLSISHQLAVLGRYEELIALDLSPELTSLRHATSAERIGAGLTRWKLESLQAMFAEVDAVIDIRINNDVGASYNTLGTETGDAEQFRLALTYLTAALQHPDVEPVLQVSVYNNIGYANDGLHNVAAANAAYRKAIALGDKLKADADHRFTPWANLLLSACTAHDLAGAHEAWKHIESIAPSMVHDDREWKVPECEGRLREAEGQFSQAETLFRKAIAVIEVQRSRLLEPELKTTYFRDRLGPYAGLMRVLQHEHRLDDFISVSEQVRSRLLADQLANARILKGLQPELAQREQQQQANEKKLLVAQAEAAAPGAQERSATVPSGLATQVEETNQKLILDFARQAPEYAQLKGAVAINGRTAAGLLDKGTCLLTYTLSLGALLRPDGSGRVVKLGAEPREIRAAIRRYVDFLRNPDHADTHHDAQFLYRVLLSPFESDLARVHRVVVVPSDQLTYVPFAALQAPDGSYVIQRHSVVTTPSATVLQFCRQKNTHRRKSMLAYALGTVRSGDNEALPGTLHEVEGLHTLYPDAQVVTEDAFTVQSVQSLAPQFDIIHFATHGILNAKDPLKSAVITANGPLSVGDIFNLDLHANLIVLSACQTSLGRLYGGDELVGLSRAFMYAGTPSVVTTLWSISDEATSDLMQAFYRKLRTEDKGEALRQAQLEIIRKHPQPYYWAAFQLLGDWQ